MANKKTETKDNSVVKSTKKTETNVKNNSQSKKTSSTKSAVASKSKTTKAPTKKNTTKSSTKVTKKTTTKKVSKKKNDLEKTLILENIENTINKIVDDNENVKIKEQEIDKINIQDDVKIENAKFTNKKRNKKLLAIGVIISLLGIIALIISLIANRIVDRNFISDNSITLMVITSILIECFGAFIIINES